MVKLGVAGIGNGIDTIPEFVKKGILAGEVEFVRQVYMKNDNAKEVGLVAKENDFELSVHCPYFVNLNSDEKVKIEASQLSLLSNVAIAAPVELCMTYFHSTLGVLSATH